MAFRSAAYAVVARIFKIVDSKGKVQAIFGSIIAAGSVPSTALEMFNNVSNYVRGYLSWSDDTVTSAPQVLIAGPARDEFGTLPPRLSLSANASSHRFSLLANSDVGPGISVSGSTRDDVADAQSVEIAISGVGLAGSMELHTFDAIVTALVEADLITLTSDGEIENVVDTHFYVSQPPGGGSATPTPIFHIEQSTKEVKDGNGRQFIRGNNVVSDPTMFQAGEVSLGTTDGSGDFSVVFPEPFAVAPFVEITPTTIINRIYYVRLVSATGFTVRAYTASTGAAATGRAVRLTWSASGRVTV